jgi:hypothetical protein
MIYFILRVVLACAIAIGVGALSAHYAVEGSGTLGSRRIGSWFVYPQRGTDGANPYAKARQARDGTLPLGISEGVELFADRDSAGRPLDLGCSYRIDGGFPTARFWTVYALTGEGRAATGPKLGLPAIHSRQIARAADGTFAIGVGPSTMPGNWLPTSGAGRMTIVLTLYDTPLSIEIGNAELLLPQVTREGCGA